MRKRETQKHSVDLTFAWRSSGLSMVRENRFFVVSMLFTYTVT
jgi:hypothetical protein